MQGVFGISGTAACAGASTFGANTADLITSWQLGGMDVTVL
jgi:hypothetical protein